MNTPCWPEWLDPKKLAWLRALPIENQSGIREIALKACAALYSVPLDVVFSGQGDLHDHVRADCYLRMARGVASKVGAKDLYRLCRALLQLREAIYGGWPGMLEPTELRALVAMVRVEANRLRDALRIVQVQVRVIEHPPEVRQVQVRVIKHPPEVRRVQVRVIKHPPKQTTAYVTVYPPRAPG